LIDPQNHFPVFEAQNSRVFVFGIFCLCFFVISPTTMTMTTTAAQELFRGDAQIEAPPVGGFTHGLDPILDKSLNTGKCYVE
jgi:hypothetical protein